MLLALVVAVDDLQEEAGQRDQFAVCRREEAFEEAVTGLVEQDEDGQRILHLSTETAGEVLTPDASAEPSAEPQPRGTDLFLRVQRQPDVPAEEQLRHFPLRVQHRQVGDDLRPDAQVLQGLVVGLQLQV